MANNRRETQRPTYHKNRCLESLEPRHLLTTASMNLLGDLTPGAASSEIGEFASNGDLLYFQVNETELWRTDGTQEGTQKLQDIDREGKFFDVGNGVSIFDVADAGGISMWRSDGTQEGTFELIDSMTRPYARGRLIDSAHAFGLAYFTMTIDSRVTGVISESIGLYQTDGTRSGTKLIGRDTDISKLTSTSEGVFYHNALDDRIYVVDGANASPKLVPIPGGWEGRTARSFPLFSPFDTVGSSLFFVTNQADGAERSIAWTTDGTSAGTTPIATSPLPSFGDSFLFRWNSGRLGDRLLIPFVPGRLLLTDGTFEGTTVLDTPGFFQGNEFLGEFGGKAYYANFQADFPKFGHVISTDGNTTSLEFSGLVNSVEFNDAVLLSGGVAIDDIGFDQLGDPFAGSPYWAHRVGDSWYLPQLRGDSSFSSRTMYRVVSHSPEQTVQVPFEFGDSLGNPPFGSPLFTYNATNREVLAWDGGTRPSVVATDVDRIRGGRHDDNGLFHFTEPGDRQRIWVSDGTPAGTTLIDDRPRPDFVDDAELIRLNGQTLVMAYRPDVGYELFSINATRDESTNFVRTGEYTIPAGTDLPLQATVEGVEGPLLFEWDLNGDGVFDLTTNEAESLVGWDTLTGLDPPISLGQQQTTLRATDDSTGEVFESESVLNVNQNIWLDLPRLLEPGRGEIEVHSAGFENELEYALADVSDISPEFYPTDREARDASVIPWIFEDKRPSSTKILAVATDKTTGEQFLSAGFVNVTSDPRNRGGVTLRLPDPLITGSVVAVVESDISPIQTVYRLEVTGPNDDVPSLRLRNSDPEFQLNLREPGEYVFDVVVTNGIGQAARNVFVREVVPAIQIDATDGREDLVVTDQGSAYVGESKDGFVEAKRFSDWIPNVINFGKGDLNGDGLEDIVGHAANGTITVGLSTGSSYELQNFGSLSRSITWTDFTVGDFDGDGKDDVMVRADSNGSWWALKSTGTRFSYQKIATFAPQFDWVFVTGDFNGDGRHDVAGRANSNGTWWVALSNGTTAPTSKWGAWSTNASWTAYLVGDFDGDGDDDVAARGSLSGWFVAQSTGSSFNTSKWGSWNGNFWESFTVGDFDGDGTDDIAGRATTNGDWWLAVSQGSSFSNSRWGNWPTNTNWNDVQAADFNGDGRSDLAGRADTGAWWLLESNGSRFDGRFGVNFGSGVADSAVGTFASGEPPLESQSITSTGAIDQLLADFDRNGEVDFADFLILSANFGNTEATRGQGDTNHDNRVDFTDFLILADRFAKLS